MKKGHRARVCKAFDVLCNKCGQASHHVSLCDVGIVQSVPSVSEFQFSPYGQNKTPITSSPSSLHVGTGGRVALQTARAVIRGEGEPYTVRVLFDAGSHRSFITSKAAQRTQLARIRQEWLGISTFGQRSKDMRLRDVIEVKTRCFREAYTGLPVVRATENQKALNCVVLKYSIPVSEE